MIIPNIKNLIKDDFSDFTAFQGAVVTKNKTFPIEVFRGGRNLLLETDNYRAFNSNSETLEIKHNNSSVYRVTVSNPDVDNNLGMFFNSFTNASLLEVGKEYVISVDYFIENFYGAATSSSYIRLTYTDNTVETFNYYGSNGLVNFHFENNWNKWHTLSGNFTPTKEVKNVWFYFYASKVNDASVLYTVPKIELGSTPTEYSPAPEDGYGLNLPNGAYHIETSGGNHLIKYLVQKGTQENNINYVGKIVLHAFSNFTTTFNSTPLSFHRPTINETSTIEQEYEGNGVNGLQVQFRAVNISDSLDFIASDPSIIDETSINSMNILDIVQLPEISREDKQLTILSTDEVIVDDFISFNMSTKGSLYQRNMKYCEVVLSGKYELTGEWLNVKRFIASDVVDGGNLQEIDYGDFGVLKSEYDDTTQRTKLTCYDRMLQAQIPYDSEVMNLTYPMTVSQVLNRLAIVCKLDLVVNTVNNLYQVIATDLWANQSFTYADVLDHIAQATTSIISIRNNKLEIFNPIENDFTIQGKFYSLKIGESYGKTNIVNVSQEPQHYNKFAPSNALDIPLEDRKELAFSNNPILNQDMQTWADRLYLQTKDLEYSTFESSTIGYGIFEVGDMIDVYEAGEDVIHRVMITNETFDFKHALTTEIGSNLPMVHKNQYVVETDQVRQGQTTYLIVDQLNGVIEALVQKVDDEADKTAQLTIRVDDIDLKVSNISNGSIIGNFNPENYLGWEGGSRLLYVAEYSKLRYLSGLTYAMGFQPVKFPQSLSEWGLSFFNNGSATSPFGYVVPTEVYSYRAKAQRFKPFSIDLLEYKDMLTPFHKSTRFTFNNPQAYVQFTSALDPETVFVRIKFNVTGVTPNDRLEITENMYNRGLPKEYFVSGAEALVYAQSNIQVLSDGIKLNSEAVDTLSNDIHNAGVEINALEGIEVYGKKFEIQNEARDKVIFGVDTVEGQEQVSILGSIQSEGGEIAFDSKNKVIKVGSASLVNMSDNGGMGIIGQGLTIGYGYAMPPTAAQVIRWGKPTGVGTFFATYNQLDTSLYAINSISISNLRGKSRIGVGNERLGTIYLQDQPDVASDTRYKNDIQDIDPFLLDMIAKYVIPKRYETQFDDKLHFGYIAQDVEMALYQYFYQSSVLNGMNKLEASRFANTQIAQFAVLSKSDSYMSLLYGELAVLMDAYNRSRIDELEERLTKLELML